MELNKHDQKHVEDTLTNHEDQELANTRDIKGQIVCLKVPLCDICKHAVSKIAIVYFWQKASSTKDDKTIKTMLNSLKVVF